jgi:hypothetical protein
MCTSTVDDADSTYKKIINLDNSLSFDLFSLVKHNTALILYTNNMAKEDNTAMPINEFIVIIVWVEALFTVVGSKPLSNCIMTPPSAVTGAQVCVKQKERKVSDMCASP